MALYKHGNHLTQSQDSAFDTTHARERKPHIRASIDARPAVMKLQLQVATSFLHKIIGNTIPLTGPLSGSYWYIQYSGKNLNFLIWATDKNLFHSVA